MLHVSRYDFAKSRYSTSSENLLGKGCHALKFEQNNLKTYPCHGVKKKKKRKASAQKLDQKNKQFIENWQTIEVLYCEGAIRIEAVLL